MQRLLLSIVLSLFISWVEAQPGNSVAIGKIDSIDSKKLHEKRAIWIHVPESAKSDPKKKYPVVYLLDAEWNFASTASTISFLSSVNGNNFWPEAILVGIVNTNRKRDLTPTHVVGGLWIDNATSSVSGGGETFMAFIEQELIPHIDSTYPTTPYRILVGHSLGGLMVINALLHHKTLFKGYIAIDPSMWWDNQRLLQEVEGALKATSYSGISLFLAMAHTQPGEMDTLRLQNDTTSGTLHPRSILKLANYLMAKRQNGLQASFKYYDQDTHSSVPLIATYDALHFLFKDYPLTLKDSYYSDPTFDFTSFLKAHFENLTSEYGMTDANGKTLLPPEALVNNLAYYLFNEKKQFDRAEALFAMNLKNYPESFLAYNFLGDLYKAKGDKSRAVASYKKSLSIKETSEVRIKLEKAEQMVIH
ncbi:alpha/beta hydrolase [Spirosoma sp. HMF4905]|uniref:Alpha/beta hydrolase n=1 Tax=Spirosoma arboris TaxID=2682092 RepID=A0A7K1SHW3_9BACT|nr:alpha/beta hydrolase-fold protein [Spirosoma arboris]MVM33294.1 alpha/beta hydrolase [Spirosoma arboris]